MSTVTNTKIIRVLNAERFDIERVPQTHDTLETMNNGDRLCYKLSEAICERLRNDPATTLRKAHNLLNRFDNDYAQKAWRELLSHPIDHIIATLTEFSDQGQWLRSCSPFAGVLSDSERTEIIQKLRADSK
jgi:hypothetical protein